MGGRFNYDDWNYSNGDLKSSNESSLSGYSRSKSSLVFLFTVLILTIINLVNSYSSGLGLALQLNNSAYYLFRQAIFIAIGIVATLFVVKIPSAVIKPVSALLILMCIVALAANTFLKISFISSQTFMHFVFGSSILYWSSFFSNRENSIETLKEMFVPALFTVALMFLILVNSGYTYAFSYLIVTVLLFLLFGVRFFTVLLVVLYAALPIAVYVLLDVNRIKTVLEFIVPGLYSKTSSTLGITAKSAIASGSIFGQGLGNGQFKNLLENQILGKYGFCNYAEEMGFAGVLFIFILVLIYFLNGFRSSEAKGCKDLFLKDCALGYSMLFVFNVVSNLGNILGLIPIDGITFPFLSAGPEIILLLLESGFIFKSLNKDADDNSFSDNEMKAVSNENKNS